MIDITNLSFLLTTIPLIVSAIVFFIIYEIIKLRVFRNMAIWCVLSVLSQTILMKVIPWGPFAKYTHFISLLSIIIIPSLIMSFIVRKDKNIIFWSLSALFMLVIDLFIVHVNVAETLAATIINISVLIIIIAGVANIIRQKLLQIIGIEISLILILLVVGSLVFYTFDFFWGQNLVLENEILTLQEISENNVKIGEIKFKSLIKKPDSLAKIYYCLKGDKNILIEEDISNNNEFRDSLELFEPFENIDGEYEYLVISENNECSLDDSLGYVKIE